MDPTSNIFKKLYTGDNRIKLLEQRYLPRWIVILLDTFLCATSALLTYLILKDTRINFHETLTIPWQGVILISVNVFYFFLFKTYSGIIRHSTFTDIIKLALTSFSTVMSVIIFNLIYEAVNGERIFLTTSLLLYLFVSFTVMLLFRVSVKESYQFIKNSADFTKKKKIAIIGIDDHSISLGKALLTETSLPYVLEGFLTRTQESKKIKILGKPVIHVSTIKDAVSKYGISAVLLISEAYSGKEKNDIVEECLAANLEILNVPSMQSWTSKEDIQQQIKPLQIEDLLERNPIKISDELIHKDLKDKVILVTGGAGSIGSEIVRQLSNYETKLVVILDQAESAIHELELSLRLRYPNFFFITELADISNMYRLTLLFEKYDFDVIYHAAAYKHVPLIERNPHEAIYVNILGTLNLCHQAINKNIEKFVMVSTDKAVNPTNVMGASKRAAEMYVQALQEQPSVETKFITTRFGNVLGSSGSVIPHFRKQISQGGPVTVTHRDIIRYFMTIPEACQLVLQAGTMGNGGEIFVFDMGKPVKIINLAERMIKLSGLEPYQDIDIKITGLRPGEKLYEELLNDSSTVLPTHHPKIMISKTEVGDFNEIKDKIENLVHVATSNEDKKVVQLLKELVIEFKSENSEYEALDGPPDKAVSRTH